MIGGKFWRIRNGRKGKTEGISSECSFSPGEYTLLAPTDIEKRLTPIAHVWVSMSTGTPFHPLLQCKGGIPDPLAPISSEKSDYLSSLYRAEKCSISRGFLPSCHLTEDAGAMYFPEHFPPVGNRQFQGLILPIFSDRE